MIFQKYLILQFFLLKTIIFSEILLALKNYFFLKILLQIADGVSLFRFNN